MKRRTLQVDGLEIAFDIGGEGPALLLLHGFSLTGGMWTALAEDLMRDFTVIVADLPGHGGSAPLPGAFDMDRAADLMLGLLDRLEIDRFVGVGHSAGGWIALHMAHKQPDRTAALVLAASAHRSCAEGLELIRNDYFERLDPDSQAYYRAIHPEGDSQIEAVFVQLRQLADMYSEYAVSPERLAVVTAPAFLVSGDEDPYFTPKEVGELRGLLPGDLLWIVEGQGHMPVFADMGGSPQAAQAFSGAIPQFLGDCAL